MARDVTALAVTLGPRPGGSAAEKRAAAFLAARFQEMGYSVRLQKVPLPGGRSSANVIADPMRGKPRLILGGHYDSRANTPGADDNASGIAVLLETARLVAARDIPVQFVAFGAEEMIDRNREHHHFGSRHFVHSASPELLRGLAGMLCLDSVGAGRSLHIDGMPRGDGTLARQCRVLAWSQGLRPAVGRGTTLSDHEAFARARVAVALYHAVPYRAHHTPGDIPALVSPERLRQVARGVLAAIDALCRKPASPVAAPSASRQRATGFPRP